MLWEVPEKKETLRFRRYSIARHEDLKPGGYHLITSLYRLLSPFRSRLVEEGDMLKLKAEYAIPTKTPELQLCKDADTSRTLTLRYGPVIA